jgi:glycosyltransferase involved in cell wall biosynthesis
VGGALYQTEGSQHSLEDLRRLAAQLGVADRVGFTGHAEDAEPVMRALDVVVHASTEPEPFGLVIAEAMACGRAVVATAVGGLRDAVVDRVTGVHVPPGDPIRLAQALRGLLADGAMPMAYGYAGRDRVESRYGWPRIAAATVAVYRDVLARRAAASAATGSGR